MSLKTKFIHMLILYKFKKRKVRKYTLIEKTNYKIHLIVNIKKKNSKVIQMNEMGKMRKIKV